MKLLNIKNIKETEDGFSALVEWDKFEGEFIPTSVNASLKGYLGDLYNDLISGVYGEAEPKAEVTLTSEDRLANIKLTVSQYMGDLARDYGYDSLQSAVSYADEPAVPKFQQEGQAFREWRSLVWDKCYDILEQWEAGLILEPTAQEVLDQLPPLEL